MVKDVFFSIIVPVYNCEKTLKKCLFSITEQSFRDFQIIVVDDGSIDNSKCIMEQFVEYDERFKLISMPHAGTGVARNKGLLNAQGRYVLYIDADDYWIDKNLLLDLYNNICYQYSDIIMFQMAKVSETGVKLNRYQKPDFQKERIVLEIKDVYLDLVRDGQTLASACNKCVRKAVLDENNILFKEGTLAEDIDWVLQLFACANTICLLNVEAYAYTQHKKNSRSMSKDAPNDLLHIIKEWDDKLINEEIPDKRAVAGVISFEYGICMGNYYLLAEKERRALLARQHILEYGLDKKTKLIYSVKKIVGFNLTCILVRIYLLLRKIW